MTPASLDTLTIGHTFAAPRERIFRAWTTADDVKQWFGRPEGFDIRHVEMDARVGGAYRIEIANADLVGVIVGRFEEVSPFDLLVFTFAWEEPLLDVMDTGETRVTVRFSDVDGGTQIVLIHELLRDADVVAFHDFGWKVGFTRLEGLLG